MKTGDYLIPKTLGDALKMRAETGGRFIAGGTDLLVKIRKKHTPAPPALVSLRRIPDLTGVSVNGSWRIGASAPLSDVVDHPGFGKAFPALDMAMRCVGSVQIRSVATAGGNLCNASPASDLMPALLVLEAGVEIAGRAGSRIIPARNFCLGPSRTCMSGDEVLKTIIIEPRPKALTAYVRKNRVRMDLAQASVAVLLEMKAGICVKARVAAGAVAPTAIRLDSVESVIQGHKIDDGLLESAAQEAAKAVSPITDLRATGEYRRLIIGVLLKRAVRAALSGGVK